jgi:3-deoxy-D-manno-octulosonic-acid transferase
VPDADDLPRWEALGVSKVTLVSTGSIKFDNPAITASREGEFRALLAPLGVSQQAPIVVAGSTWAPEERSLTEAVRALRADIPDLFLILVPRHIERTAEILRELESLGLRIVRRSTLAAGTPEKRADVLLVDTTGELRDWYALATVVFIGKSLPGVREIGGQNPAEPAVLGKPIVFGPYMENFAALVGQLLQREAAIQIASASELKDALRDLLGNPERRKEMGGRARAALESHAGATDRVCDVVCGPG